MAPTAPDIAATAARVEELLDQIGGADPRAAAPAGELVRTLSLLYGEGLRRIIGLLDDDIRRRLISDDLVAALLVLHDLHPDPLLDRIGAALDGIRPALGMHDGDIELLGVVEDEDGVVVRLRLAGSCHGCPSSMVTVSQGVERAIHEAAPEVARVDVEGLATPSPEPDLLQISPHRPYAEDGSDCPAMPHDAGDREPVGAR
jgi:Fe-S cluster biogenesis protein NfuA